MSKRGFDESQLRKTVVTMIDKDGFNKRTVVEGPASIGSGLPTPTQDGNALISLNGEWIQQPGYGYGVTEVAETLCDFTADDFTKNNVGMYIAQIPVDETMLQHLMDLFGNTEFNVQIDDKIYNSKKDNFTYSTEPSIILPDAEDEHAFPIFGLQFIDQQHTILAFGVREKPNHAVIYREETTYTGIDSNLVKCAPFYVDLDDTRQDQSNPSYESKVTFAELDDAVKRNAPIFIRFNAYYYADEQSNDPIIDTIIMPALVLSETVPNASTGPSIQTYMLTSLFPSSFNLHGVDANSDFEIYLEFQKTNDFVLIEMFKRERTTRTSIFTNQV